MQKGEAEMQTASRVRYAVREVLSLVGMGVALSCMNIAERKEQRP
jgi:hypothetical protein